MLKVKLLKKVVGNEVDVTALINQTVGNEHYSTKLMNNGTNKLMSPAIMHMQF